MTYNDGEKKRYCVLSTRAWQNCGAVLVSREEKWTDDGGPDR